MGRNKMLVQLEEESLVRRVAGRALRARLSLTVIVLGHDAKRTGAELADLPVDIALNPDYTGPTNGSLHGALERLGPEVAAAVVMLADMVLVTEAMIGALVATAATSDAPLLVSRYGEVLAPRLLFRGVLFPELLAWTGEGCGKAVVQRHLGDALILDWSPETLTDMDTPENLEAAKELLTQSARTLMGPSPWTVRRNPGKGWSAT